MSALQPSTSIKGVVVHHHGSSSEFIRKLKGFLGDDLGFQDSQLLYSKNSSSSALHALQNPRESFRKKRSPRIDLSLIDVSLLDGPLTGAILDGPLTGDALSAAVNLQVLHERNFSPQISWKEENLVSAVPQSSSPEFYSKEEKAFKKPVTLSKILPEKQKKRCQFEASTEGEVRAQKKAKKNLNSVPQNPNPDLPMRFKFLIRELTGSTEAVFVYEKKLYRTDVNFGQNRFLIPFKQVKNDFLTEKEKEILKTDDAILGKGSIEALLIEPSRDKCKISLRKWDMGGKNCGKVSENYVLVTTWNKVVKDNNLAEGMTVQLWSFRRGDELCFALVKRGIDRG